jgi:hypothetical protein
MKPGTIRATGRSSVNATDEGGVFFSGREALAAPMEHRRAKADVSHPEEGIGVDPSTFREAGRATREVRALVQGMLKRVPEKREYPRWKE